MPPNPANKIIPFPSDDEGPRPVAPAARVIHFRTHEDLIAKKEETISFRAPESLLTWLTGHAREHGFRSTSGLIFHVLSGYALREDRKRLRMAGKAAAAVILALILIPTAHSEERKQKLFDLDTALLLTTGFLDAHSTSLAVSPTWRPHQDGGWVRYRERNALTNLLIDRYEPALGKRLAWAEAKNLALDWVLKKLERKGPGWREAGKSLRYSFVVLQSVQAVQNYRKAR